MNEKATVFQKLRALLVAWATTRTVLISLGLYLLSIVALHLYDIQIARFIPEVTKPDLRFGYSSEEISEIFTLLGSEGRQIYLQHLVVDSVMPVLFALSVLLVVAHVLPRGLGLLAIAPVTFMVLDLIENGAFAWMLVNYPSISPSLVAVNSVITTIKLSSFLIALPTMVLTYAGWIVTSMIRWRSLSVQKR